VLYIIDKVGNFSQFDDKTLTGNESNLHTKIAFTHNILHWTHNVRPAVSLSAIKWSTNSVFTVLAWKKVEIWRPKQRILMRDPAKLISWSIITSRVEGAKVLILLTGLCTSFGQVVWSRLPVKRTFVAAIVFFTPIPPTYDLIGRRVKHSLRDRGFRAPHPWGDNWPRSQCRPSGDDSSLSPSFDWMILTPYPNFNSNSFISTTVLCTKSFITLG